MITEQRKLTSDDFAKDIANENLTFVSMLRTKMADEIVARLSELAEPKVGRLTFHFAATKLGKLDSEVRAFRTFITREKFKQKRNLDISHKALPERWAQHGPISIPYRTLLRGVSHALRLMKKIDCVVLGPAAKYLWPEMRKKRYQIMEPASVVYMLVPYLRLSPEIRQKIILEEMAEGRPTWADMKATINGQQMTVSACRQWGAFIFDGRITILPDYPLQSLNIQTSPANTDCTTGDLALAEPITEERTITAEYRVTKKEDESRMSLAPVQRVHLLDTGKTTELPDIHITLNDKLRQDFGDLDVGDKKELSLTVRVLMGFRNQQGDVPV
jgi:hypothetical protein